MKKVLFLVLSAAAFFTALLFADGVNPGEKSEETTETEEKSETNGKIVARGLTTIQIPNVATVKGPLDKKVIDEHVRKIVPKLRFCYENGVLKHPEIAGTVVLEFVIQPTGNVTESKVVSTTMDDSDVEKCVADQVGKIKFPASKAAATVVVNYPFVFRNAVIEEKVAKNDTPILLWSSRSPEKMDWQSASDYCRNLSENGSEGWHLPNIDELRKGIIGCPKTEFGGECRVSEKNGCLSSDCRSPKGSCNCERIAKGSFYSSNCDEDTIGLWSSSTLSDKPDSAWGVVFYSAMVGSSTKNGKFYARCVKELDSTDETVSSESPVIMGALNRCTIDSYVRKSVGDVKKCYEKGHEKNPKLEGRVVINMVIAASGDVSSAKVQRSTLGDAEVENCVAGVIKKIRFPKPKGGGIVIVNYPFVFKTNKN